MSNIAHESAEFDYPGVAQVAEHSLDKAAVGASITSTGTKFIIAVMAQWEVTIRAFALVTDDEGHECQYQDQFVFAWTGTDFITTMMSIQQKLDTLNERQRKKWETAPREARFIEEFQIVGIIETDHIVFGDRWIDEFVEKGVISREYTEDEI